MNKQIPAISLFLIALLLLSPSLNAQIVVQNATTTLTTSTTTTVTTLSTTTTIHPPPNSIILSAVSTIGQNLIVSNSSGFQTSLFQSLPTLTPKSQNSLLSQLAASNIPVSNSIVKVPYGTRLNGNNLPSTGTTLNYSSVSYSTNQASIYQIIINKTSPNCELDVNGGIFKNPTSFEIPVRSPIFPGQKFYNVTGQFICDPIPGNPMTYSANIFLTNGTILYSNTFLASNANVQFRFIHLSTSQIATLSLNVSGNSNYTSEGIDPVTPPVNVIAYVPVTFTNFNTLVGTPDPFDFNYTFNSVAFNQYVNGNVNNIEPFYANGVIIPTWIEQSNSNTLSNTMLWMLMNSLAVNGMAGDHITIYIGIVAMGTNTVDGVNVGYAPTLPHQTYGEFDNGYTVFPRLYCNFKGSSIPAACGSWDNTAAATISNRLILTNSGAGSYVATSTKTFNFGNVIDVATYRQGATGANGNPWLGFITEGSNNAYGYLMDSAANTIRNFNWQTAGGGSEAEGNYIISFDWFSATGGTGYTNYAGAASGGAGTSQSGLRIGEDTESGVLKNTMDIYWIRDRARPPNYVMPTTTNTALVVVTPSLSTVTLTNPSNTVLDVGQIASFTSNWISGLSPFQANYFIANSITPSVSSNTLHTAIAGQNDIFTYTTTSADTPNSPLKANVFVTDNTPSTLNSIYTSSFTVNAVPTIAITISNSITDSGQTQVFTLTGSLGSGKLSCQLLNQTAGSMGVQVQSNVIIQTIGGSNTISMVTSSPIQNNVFSYNALCYDMATTTAYVINSPTISMTVNSAISLSIIYPTPSSIQQADSSTITYKITGGSQPYTYNYMVVNTAAYGTNNAVANGIFTGVVSTTNSILLTFPNYPNDIGTLTIYGNVIDSASSSGNLLSTNTILVNHFPGSAGVPATIFNQASNISISLTQSNTTIKSPSPSITQNSTISYYGHQFKLLMNYGFVVSNQYFTYQFPISLLILAYLIIGTIYQFIRHKKIALLLALLIVVGALYLSTLAIP